MLFGERLKHLREGKYSQEELADMLHVHSITISKWENGVQEPRAKKIAELAKILGTTTAYLLGDTDSSRKDELSKTDNKSLMANAEHSAEHSLVYERNGERMELPPTEEGYAIFKEIARMIANREVTHPAVATA